MIVVLVISATVLFQSIIQMVVGTGLIDADIKPKKPIPNVTIGETDFMILRKRLSWEQANDYCEKCIGTFATFASVEQIEHIIDKLYDMSTFNPTYDEGKLHDEFGLDRRYWIGLRDKYPTEGEWKWVESPTSEGKVLTKGELDALPWYPDQPDHSKQTEHCAGLWNPEYYEDDFKKNPKAHGDKSTHRLNDMSCEIKLYFICEKDDFPKKRDKSCGPSRFNKHKKPMGRGFLSTKLGDGSGEGEEDEDEDEESFAKLPKLTKGKVNFSITFNITEQIGNVTKIITNLQTVQGKSMSAFKKGLGRMMQGINKTLSGNQTQPNKDEGKETSGNIVTSTTPKPDQHETQIPPPASHKDEDTKLAKNGGDNKGPEITTTMKPTTTPKPKQQGRAIAMKTPIEKIDTTSTTRKPQIEQEAITKHHDERITTLKPIERKEENRSSTTPKPDEQGMTTTSKPKQQGRTMVRKKEEQITTTRKTRSEDEEQNEIATTTLEPEEQRETTMDPVVPKDHRRINAFGSGEQTITTTTLKPRQQGRGITRNRDQQILTTRRPQSEEDISRYYESTTTLKPQEPRVTTVEPIPKDPKRRTTQESEEQDTTTTLKPRQQGRTMINHRNENTPTTQRSDSDIEYEILSVSEYIKHEGRKVFKQRGATTTSTPPNEEEGHTDTMTTTTPKPQQHRRTTTTLKPDGQEDTTDT